MACTRPSALSLGTIPLTARLSKTIACSAVKLPSALAATNGGEFRLGRQYNVASRLMASMYGLDLAAASRSSIRVEALASARRSQYDNLALYESPSMGGFRVSAGYAFNADDRNAAQTGFRTADNTRAITTGISYANGPLMAFFAYDQLNASNKLSSAQTAATPRSFTLGGLCRL